MDSAAFRRTWLPLEGIFYKVAMYILEDQEDAEDAVQDMFVRLWNLRDKETVLQPKAYGMTILRNICLDRLRRRKVSMADDIQTHDVGDDAQAPDSRMIDRDTLERVYSAVESLPERQRGLLKMRVIQGMEYSEIARVSGLSEVNVRVHVSNARKALRKMIEL